MKHNFPEHLDILEAVYDLYIQKGKPEQPPIVTLYAEEIGKMLRTKGFEISDDLVWQRLYEYNKTIEIIENNAGGSKTTKYWLCTQDINAHNKNPDKPMPLMFQMGTATNEISGLMRKRELEEEQLRFWTRYKWAAIATIALTVVTSVCAVINCWVNYHTH
jgi:hypothetical protein